MHLPPHIWLHIARYASPKDLLAVEQALPPLADTLEEVWPAVLRRHWGKLANLYEVQIEEPPREAVQSLVRLDDHVHRRMAAFDFDMLQWAANPHVALVLHNYALALRDALSHTFCEVKLRQLLVAETVLLAHNCKLLVAWLASGQAVLTARDLDRALVHLARSDLHFYRYGVARAAFFTKAHTHLHRSFFSDYIVDGNHGISLNATTNVVLFPSQEHFYRFVEALVHEIIALPKPPSLSLLYPGIVGAMAVVAYLVDDFLMDLRVRIGFSQPSAIHVRIARAFIKVGQYYIHMAGTADKPAVSFGTYADFYAFISRSVLPSAGTDFFRAMDRDFLVSQMPQATREALVVLHTPALAPPHSRPRSALHIVSSWLHNASVQLLAPPLDISLVRNTRLDYVGLAMATSHRRLIYTLDLWAELRSSSLETLPLQGPEYSDYIDSSHLANLVGLYVTPSPPP